MRRQERKGKVALAATEVENASTIPDAEENSLATKSVQAGGKSADENHYSTPDLPVASDVAPDLDTLRKSFKARLQGKIPPKDGNVLDEDADSDEDVDPVDAFRSYFNDQLEMYQETVGHEDKVFSDFVIAFFLLIILVVFGILVYASISAVDGVNRTKSSVKSSASESGRDQLIVERRKKRRRRERERRRANHLRAQSIHMNDPDPPLI